MNEVWVLYFFQGELGESMETPNAFSIQSNSPSQLSMREILAFFPIPNTHDLVFRVQCSDSECGYVWMDISNDAEPLPLSRAGYIFLKILRIDEENVLKRKVNLKRKEKITRSTPTPLTKDRPPVYTSSQQIDQRSRTPMAEADLMESASQQMQKMHTSSPAKENDMLHSGESDADLVDFGNFVQSSPVVDRSSPPAPLPSRDELVQRRLDEVKDRVNTALEFKHELDENAKKEGEELEAAKGKHDVRLTSWAYNGSEKRNVRSLLSTMHTVVWPDCKWKAIGLGDVIEPKQVKLQYRKAMLVVHPDRCSGLSGEVRFIAKRIFEAINEAFQDFLKKESPE